MSHSNSPSFLALLVDDGRPPLAVVGLALVLAGGFALFVATRGEFLPHDVAYLGMTPQELCAVNECRVVHFMIHDRVAFGGALIAIGIMYLWLALGPMARGERWAWELLAASGVVGFASFLAYLGYGYLDTWHGAATLALLPVFLVGLARTRSWLGGVPSPRASLRRGWSEPWRSSGGVGRLLLLATGIGMILGGGTILVVGMTSVFVPQDL